MYLTSKPVIERRGSRSLGIEPPLLVRMASGVVTMRVTPDAPGGRFAEIEYWPPLPLIEKLRSEGPDSVLASIERG